MVALQSGGDFELFWKLLGDATEIAHAGLKARINSLKDATADVAPVLYKDGAFGVRMKPNESVLELFKSGRASLSLGYIGLAETAHYMFQTDSIISGKMANEAYQFTLEVAKFLKYKTEQWKSEEGFGYSLYSTPSEGYCSRALEKTKSIFGVVPNVTDKDYFTNSFHIDVREKITPFEKIDLEAPFHWIANAGHISYTELPDMKDKLDDLEVVWDYAMAKLDYFGTNIGVDKCHECGTVGDFVLKDSKYSCPSCTNENPDTLEIVKRISGYLGNITQRPVNKGKQDEFCKRVKHC